MEEALVSWVRVKYVYKEYISFLYMPEETSLSLFVPLIFLVILKLSDIAREVDLKETHGNPPWDVVIWSTYGWGATLPNLGRFNFIHTANFYFAAAAFFIVHTVSSNGLNKIIFLILIGVVWILLPIFEVDEYDSISPSAEGEWPESFRHHYLFTSLTIVLILIPHRIGHIIPESLPVLKWLLALFVAMLKVGLLLLITTHSIEGFLNRLDDELSTAEE